MKQVIFTSDLNVSSQKTGNTREAIKCFFFLFCFCSHSGNALSLRGTWGRSLTNVLHNLRRNHRCRVQDLFVSDKADKKGFVFFKITGL